jgi:hypothetical protein
MNILKRAFSFISRKILFGGGPLLVEDNKFLEELQNLKKINQNGSPSPGRPSAL